MSRHRIVKGLDLDDELYDFDGADGHYGDADDVDEMSENDRAQMQACTVKVRQILTDVPQIGDTDIEEALWYYYFDIEKSVAWLRNKFVDERSKRKNESRKAVKANDTLAPIYPLAAISCAGFSAAEFFQDCPWLRVPEEFRSEMLLEPLFPRGGLLGGSSSSQGKKPSKLASLAEARKRRDEQKIGTGKKENTAPNSKGSSSLALLDRIQRKSAQPAPGDAASLAGNSFTAPMSEVSTAHASQKPARPEISSKSQAGTRPTDSVQRGILAAPSDFARAVLGNAVQFTSLPAKPFLLPFDNGIRPNPFAEPSPDGVVLAAQAKQGNKSAARNRSNNDVARGASDDMKQAPVKDSVTVKSKNLDVVSEYERSNEKRRANFVVIGHVDHGKSTLMGRLLYDLKVVNQRTMDKYRQEAEKLGKSSFAMAWVLDQTSEERRRGVTIDVATNSFETDRTKFTILDAPGHRDFIPHMIAGASQADFAVLVIDAAPNAFESGLRGQTKEHALLVRSLGVQRIIIAINKMDLVSVPVSEVNLADLQAAWDKERFEEIQQQTMAFLNTAGFQSANLSFVPCSGLSGDNIVQGISDDRASWYRGPTLVEMLDGAEPIQRDLQKPLRMMIGDVFRGGIQNPISISGRLDAGSVQVGDAILVMPSGERAVIKGIEVDEQSRDWAVAGQLATLHLADIDANQLRPGDMICSPTTPIQNTSAFTMKILAFDHVTPMTVDVHRGRFHAAGQITQLLATLDKASGAVAKRRPRIVPAGAVARVALAMSSPVPFEAASRLVLRAGGETLAAGLVE